MQSLNSQQIAEIASKLARNASLPGAVPNVAVPGSAGAVPSAQGMPSQAYAPSIPQVASAPIPTASSAIDPSHFAVQPSAQPTFAMPDMWPAPVAAALSAMAAGQQVPALGQGAPAWSGTPSGAAPAGASPPSQSDSLKAFVSGIRYQSVVGSNSGTSFGLKNNPATATSRFRSFDVNQVRRDFPALHQTIHGKPLIWFDNAATTHKPQSVIDTLSQYYATDYSNIHRGAHTLAARSTERYEKSRDKVRDFIGAGSSEEIIFVRGTTEGINLVANSFSHYLRPGDEIVLSTLEHHANIVPWQIVAKATGAKFRVIPINDRGEIMLDDYRRLLGPKTKLVALTHASNSLGTIPPVAEMTQLAHRVGARVLIDGAQSVPHMRVNVQEIGSDFYVFSGHKVFGPTGIGAVYMTKEMQELLPPWQGGGNMIRNVTFEETSYADPPAKFEAGTPNIADAIGLGAAIDYVTQFEPSILEQYEHRLLEYATEKLQRIPGLSIIGNAEKKVGVVSFVLANRSTEQIGKQLDAEGIAVRSGHHCAQPSLRRFGVETTVRPSFSFYNTCEEIDVLADAVRRLA